MKNLPTALLLITAFTAHGQQSLSLNEAIDLALKHNERMRAATLEIDYQQQLKHQVGDVGKTSIKYVRGQINTYDTRDNSVTLEQNIPFPLVFAADNKVAKAMVHNAVLQKDVAGNELVYAVKQTWYLLLYLKAREALLRRQDSIYDGFVRQAARRYEEGNASLLERATAETERNDIRNQLVATESEIIAQRRMLQTLLNSDDELQVTDTLAERALRLTPSVNTLTNNPALVYARHQPQIDEATRHAEGTRMLPDINLGFFTQTLIGTPDENNVFADVGDRFTGFQVGLSIPLWFGPQVARVHAAELSRQRDEALASYSEDMLAGEWEQSVQDYLRNKNTVDYFTSSALANAELILTQSREAYESRSIDYSEYWLALQHAIGIRENYLGALNDLNQSVIKLEYLGGER